MWPALGLGAEPPGLLYARNRAYVEPQARLSAGDEVAVIPPVSGGDFRLSGDALSVDAAVAEVRDDSAGAIATFIGTTRAHSRGRDVLYLEYEAYEGMAEQVMADLAAELARRHELCKVAIHHRVGRVDIGETSVVIAASAPHRAAALAACRDAIEELKTSVPLWKKETYVGGEEWIGQGCCRPRGPATPRVTRASGTPPRRDELPRARTPSVDGERGYEPVRPRSGLFDLARKLFAPIIALGFLIVKFGGLLLKLKVVTTGASMLVSIAAYAWLWGLPFAIGFVLLIFVHELGHVLELRRQGVPASAPLFIPFLGAVIGMKELPDDAWKEARVALAGPILGSVGAAVCWVAAEATGSDVLMGLAFVGFLLNLFNLIPIVPLDGGRAAGALHPAIWFLGLLLMVGLVVVNPNPLLLIIVILGGLDLWNRWRGREEAGDYYNLSVGQRVTVGVVYLGLVVVLGLAMSATYVEREL